MTDETSTEPEAEQTPEPDKKPDVVALVRVEDADSGETLGDAPRLVLEVTGVRDVVIATAELVAEFIQAIQTYGLQSLTAPEGPTSADQIDIIGDIDLGEDDSVGA